MHLLLTGPLQARRSPYRRFVERQCPVSPWQSPLQQQTCVACERLLVPRTWIDAVTDPSVARLLVPRPLYSGPESLLSALFAGVINRADLSPGPALASHLDHRGEFECFSCLT